jgi:hypothetical protein
MGIESAMVKALGRGRGSALSPKTAKHSSWRLALVQLVRAPFEQHGRARARRFKSRTALSIS